MKMTMMMPGWSGHGGQTLSPYVGKIEENETLLGHSVSKLLISYKICMLMYTRLQGDLLPALPLLSPLVLVL